MNTIVILSIIFLIAIFTLLWIIFIEIRLKKMFKGSKIRNLEGMIVDINKKMIQIEETESKINDHLNLIDKRLNKSIRNIETVRFNPFIESGSNQSFAISLVNDEGNGVVLSSLYARDRMSIFAKPIMNGKAEFDLSAEEKEVLNKSLKK